MISNLEKIIEEAEKIDEAKNKFEKSWYNIFSFKESKSLIASNQLGKTSRATAMFGGLGGGLGGALGGGLGGILGGVGAGAITKDPIWGALLAGLMALLTQDPETVMYDLTVQGDKVITQNIRLFSADYTLKENKAGKTLNVKETPLPTIELIKGKVSYDFDPTGTDSSYANATATPSYGSPYDSAYEGAQSQGYYYNPQLLQATMGVVETTELSFVNKGESNKTPYDPTAGILKVVGRENIYKTQYDYQDMKDKVGGDEDGFLGGIFGSDEEGISLGRIDIEDLDIETTRDYVKKFHLLFDSFQYVECGPTTYPCIEEAVGEACTIGGKTGSTGKEAVPKLLLNWQWNAIEKNTCNADNEYGVYCDTTQFTIATLRKLNEIKQFINSRGLDQCPSSNDILTKTQELQDNTIDVGITTLEIDYLNQQADIKVTVESNPSQGSTDEPIEGTITVSVERRDGTTVEIDCEETKTFNSMEQFICTATKAELEDEEGNVGGEYFVSADLSLNLCNGCENNNTSNDSITSMMLINDSDGASTCEEFSTEKNYFTKVLSANNALDSEGQAILDNVEFEAMLVKDGFTTDFKEDFDSVQNTIFNAPNFYFEDGIQDIFMSKRFRIIGPDGTQTWLAGKYNAKIIVEFKDKYTWNTDNNNIESVTIQLEQLQGNPVGRLGGLYNIAFDGMVGYDSDNGRQGYGSNFINNGTNLKDFYVSQENGSYITARENPFGDALNNINVEIDDSFYNLNNAGRYKGNVLTVQGGVGTTRLIMSPSKVVPLILNITRNESGSSQPHAYYSVTVDGMVQDLGPFFMEWKGIGKGCVDFEGNPMYNDSIGDMKVQEGAFDKAYTIANWQNAINSGTASWKGTIFAPSGTSTLIEIVDAADSAGFETVSEHGVNESGQKITVNTSDGIKTLNEVFDLIKDEKVCVISNGEYYWNTSLYEEQLRTLIEEKQQTCIPAVN